MEDIKIDVEEGVLANFQADVIVNSVNRSLLLSSGAVSRSLSLGAGPELQRECSEKYPDGVTLGDVAVTKGYNLGCKCVYHGALPSWDSEEVADKLDILCLFVSNCLMLANENALTSIAFPALGCGFLGYPANEVASTMYQCVAAFCSGMPGTSVRHVTVVIFNKGADWRHIKRAFCRELSGKFDESQTVDKKPPQRQHRRDHAARNPPNVMKPDEKPARPVLVREDSCVAETRRNACRHTLRCGHNCAGFLQERSCPPCLQKGCPGNTALNQSSEDDCAICYTDTLSAAPICVLKCSHVFHLHCTKRMLTNRWVGPRITFNFMMCPICKVPMEHPELHRQIAPLRVLQEDIRKKALQRADFEKLRRCEEVRNPASPFYRNLEALALHRYCYYLCFKCQKPYYGGLAQCEEGAEGDFKPSDLICSACSAGTNLKACKDHGTDFLEYKCRYCCSMAVFFCLGHTHFCQKCHDNFLFPRKDRIPQCPAGPCGKQLRGKCPLGIKHAPNGIEFSLGCGLCNNIHSF